MSKRNSKKTIVRLVNRKYRKQILYNRRKFKNFDGSGIGMPNAKIFVDENLTISNHQLAFNCRKLKREKLISKTYSSNGIIRIVQIHGNKPIKVFDHSKLDEAARVIFHLPLKIVKECVVFYSCVCFR